MPFFMLVSGYFLRFSIVKYNTCKQLENKLTTILIPSMIWSLILSLGKSPLGYYFLLAIFLSSVTIILVERLFKEKLRWLIYLLIILLLYTTSIKSFNLCYLFPFFLLGYKSKLWHKNIKAISFVIFLIGICFWNSSYTIWNSKTNILLGYNVAIIDLFRIVIGFVGVVTMKMVFDMIYTYFFTNHNRILSYFANTVGRETLGIYILQHIIVFRGLKYFISFLIDKIGYNPFLWNDRFLIYVITPLFSLLVLFVSYWFISTCKSNKYMKYLWGFKISTL